MWLRSKHVTMHVIFPLDSLACQAEFPDSSLDQPTVLSNIYQLNFK
jgi:hypothetical protein